MSAFTASARAFALPARVIFTFILLAYPAMLGFQGHSPWLILPLAAVFVMADVFGKWRRLAPPTPQKIGLFVAKGYPVQVIVAGFIFVSARGIGSLMGRGVTGPIQSAEWRALGVYAIVIVATGLVLIWLERGKLTVEDAISEELEARLGDVFEQKTSGTATGDAPTWRLTAPAVALTLDTVFDAPHYTHWDNLYKNEGRDKKLVADRAYLDAAGITAQEARLGIELPEALRQIYLTQNGGHVGRNVWSGDFNDPQDEDITPFSGYEDLTPLTLVGTFKDSLETFTSFEDEPSYFPKGADKMIVLAQWYMETLFLDYRGTGAPRVGFYNFDSSHDFQLDAWEADAQWWPDFETFFATLYRQERALA